MITFKEARDAKGHGSDKHHAMVFGRMNPVTSGHEAVVKKMHDVAKEHGAGHSLVVSHSQDAKKNPLSAEQKVNHAKNAFPGTNVSSSSKEKPTILHHAAELHKQGVTHLHVVAGSDRHKDMHDLLHKYNGQDSGHGHYNFKKITVHSSGERDPDAEGTEGMSASKMREHAASGNKAEFHKGTPSSMKPEHKDAMYNDVRKGMGIKEELKTYKDLMEDSYLSKLISRHRRGEKLAANEQELVASSLKRSKIYGKSKNAISSEVKEELVNELSTDLLARYKTAAGASAKAADTSGNYAKGDKRFKGINKATNKQFDNDLKKHNQVKEETLDQQADRAKQLKKFKDMMAGMKLDEVKTGNPGFGYHGQHQTTHNGDDAYEKIHAHVKSLTDSDDKTVKHYLDSAHGRHLVGHEDNHDHIKKDFKKFSKYYRPEMHEEVQIEESFEDADKHLALADKAQRNKDMFSHHMHMAEYHGSLADWHDSKGRSSAGDRHLGKAADHEELAHAIKKKSVSEGTLQPSGTDKIETAGSPVSDIGTQKLKVTKVKSFKFFTAEQVQPIQEASVKSEKHSWGKMMTVHHGASHSYPLHPEHQEAIRNLKHGEKTSFKDETGAKVNVHRDVQDVHFTSNKTAARTTVPHSHFSEEHELDEKLIGKQKNIDKNKNGKIDAQDFKILQKENAPVAPVPDKKYIRGTPEHKAYKALRKPINGHPTNVKEEKKEDPPFDGPYKSTFKKPNNPSRTGMDSARALAQRAMGKVKEKAIKEDNEQLDEVNHREFASQGKMHPDMAKHMKTGQEMDFYHSKTGDKISGIVKHTSGSEVHVKAHKDGKVGAGEVHKFNVTSKLDETAPLKKIDHVNLPGEAPHEEKWEPAKKKMVKKESLSFSDFLNRIDEIKMADLPTRKVQGRSYGADYEDPAGAFETKDDMKKAEPKKAGRKVGQKIGARANLGNSKLHQA